MDISEDEQMKFHLRRPVISMSHYCSYNWTPRLCLILDVFIHPYSHVNRTAGEIAIYAFCSLRHRGISLIKSGESGLDVVLWYLV